MGELVYLNYIAIEVLVAVIAIVVFSLFRLPIITALLCAGTLTGPYGLRLVGDAHHIEILAEVGVVLLLFTIGLEFSLSKLSQMANLLLVGGTVQVGLTTGLGVLVGRYLLEVSWAGAIVFGFILALSSTAIVLKGLTERAELDSPHGRFIVGVLIFQDLCVVPMMLLVPILSASGNIANALFLAVLKAAVVVVLTVLLSRKLIPWLFGVIDRVRSREVFTLTLVLVCMGTAGITAHVGLSLSLGAFLAGIVLADSDFRHRAFGEILPLRDIFTSLFFISLGMLFDVRILLKQPLQVVLLLLIFLFAKGFIATLAAVFMRFPGRVSWLAGVGLAQFGEFGFVLLKLARQQSYFDSNQSGAIIAAGVMSMLLTPLLMRVAPHFRAGERILSRMERLLGVRGLDEAGPDEQGLCNHTIIVGYGVAGKMLAHALRDLGQPYFVIELSAERVREFRDQGENIYYGDITSPEAMHHAAMEKAKALVLLINDPLAAQRAVAAARAEYPHVPVYTRTKYIRDRADLIELGADDVVVEEVEAGVEMLSRVLMLQGTPRNIISLQVSQAREGTIASSRPFTVPRKRLIDHEEFADLKFETYQLQPTDFATSQTLRDLDLRKNTEALAVAFRRTKELTFNPSPVEPLRSGDVLYLVGSRPAIRRAFAYLENGATEAALEVVSEGGDTVA